MKDLETRYALVARMWRDKRRAAEIAQELSIRQVQVYRALRKTGDLPPYGSKAPKARVHHERIYTGPATALVRVRRDPCPFCAVRADIGCRHRRLEYAPA